MVTIVVDTREQRPYLFKRYNKVLAVRRKLDVGDYSMVGEERRIAIERKQLGDLVGCLLPHPYGGRERFERELMRAKDYEWFCLLIEASEGDVLEHKYTSRMHPNAVLGSVQKLCERNGVHVLWAGDRRRGELWTARLLRCYQEFVLLDQQKNS